jgi:hypothetical protein
VWVFKRRPEELPLQRPADTAVPLEGVGAAFGPDRHPRGGALAALPGAGRGKPGGVFRGRAQARSEGARYPTEPLRRQRDATERPDDGKAASRVLPAGRGVAETSRDGRRPAGALRSGLHAGAQGGADHRRPGRRGKRRAAARVGGDTV